MTNPKNNIKFELHKDGTQSFILTGSHHSYTPRAKPTGFTSKIVDSSFDIKDSTVGNMVIGNTGPSKMKANIETFEKGSMNENINISGGKFNQSVIGGNAQYSNKNSNVTAGDGAPALEDLWDYDVEDALLSLLKQGITTNDLLMVFQKGQKLKTLKELFKGKDADQIKILCDSILLHSENDAS
ncbi:uncharacterized protein LOC143463057 [Clavelina lepadiformis]|uniref:Uncharacterized protein n=1 Tax=Clavelina lepadiformis TaxID=159417 RepID=A0ABP0FQM7_CLALP